MRQLNLHHALHFPECGILHSHPPIAPQVKVKNVYLAPTKLLGHSEPWGEHRPVIMANFL